MDFDLLRLAHALANRLDVLWSLVLLMVRFGAFMTVVPGLGMGRAGAMIRAPGIMMMAAASLLGGGAIAGLPHDWGALILQVVGEYMLGYLLGIVPVMIVAGVQMGANLFSTTMGLQAGSLFDPTFQTQVPDIARIYGDLCIMVFLGLGGHYMLVHAVAGFGGELKPGTFLAGASSIQTLLDITADIFRLAMSVAMPITIALMFTNFVMGFLTRAVPTINLFVMSFPLTIGIGLILAAMLVPELGTLVSGRFANLDGAVVAILQDARP